MFAVIFKAEIAEFDEEYSQTAEKMRNLAMNHYNCQEFIASCEGNQEIAISYWNSEDDIRRWHQNPEHIQAQKKGKAKWYKSWKVEVVEILRDYQNFNSHSNL